MPPRWHATDGLRFGGTPLFPIAARHGTPCWIHSGEILRARLNLLRQAMPGVAIHYAMKANAAVPLLAMLARQGIGADVVSGGELRLALAAGFPPEKLVFSGVGKTATELADALAANVGQINVESFEELTLLSRLAAQTGRTARIALRVNPDIAAGGHEKIATGRAADKFGIAYDTITELYARAVTLPGIAPIGLAVHIGSQILHMAPFRAAYEKLAALVAELRARNLPVETLDCGGGLGIAYEYEPAPLPEAWAGAIRSTLGHLELKLAIEPGRWLAGPAGLLLASVIRTRRAGMARPMLVLDAAMTELIRPALYGASHRIVPLDPIAARAPTELTDVVGPVCESSDVFAREIQLPALEDGAVVAILDAGAYGAVMSSTYNARPPAPQIWLDRGEEIPA